ncbi:hypothetical protein GCM10007973_18320 [Polymorphobacter multimanifer]|uniref:HK97 family phage portal protein n=1 Tax=Polymorphobacter multimanifer TaxID=1070431 RepID=A0A841L814_9SPHN|nr:phage portal protein [Polymorphobacter multimanifer]MBB6228346.1 HK97 family phage portal protein [Polymorphobacter multimanifer]GGI82197.1 hypothetical protein GCM10007973_18320 [Polymorphobacter multimanifer]
MAETASPPEKPNALRSALDWLLGTGPIATGGGSGFQNSRPLGGITAASGEYYSMFTGTSGDDVPALSLTSASSVTAVHACTALISGAISSLPVSIYQRTPQGEQEELFNEDLWWLLNEQFNPRWSAAKGWEYLGMSILLQGDAFAIIERRGPRITGLRPIHPIAAEVRPSNDGRRLVYRFTFDWADGADMLGSRIYDQDDVLHFPGIGFDGLRGMSPLRSFLRMAGGVAQALQNYNGKFFTNGARPDYVITGDMTEEQITQSRASIDAYHGGLANSRRPMLLSGGLEVKTISLPLEDVQLLGLRQFAVEEIARAYLVPPFMIGHTQNTTSWGSGVEAMGVGFVRYTLRNYLSAIENELNRKLYRGGNKFLAFDTSELERADLKSLFEALRTAMGRAGEAGFMTPDEVRRVLKLRKVPGGDALATGEKEMTDAQAA